MSTSESEGRESGEGFWSAAGDLDEQVAEEHASKIVALWELGGSFEAMKPASGAGAAEDDGDWAAAPEQPSDGPTDTATPEGAAAGDDSTPATAATDAATTSAPAPAESRAEAATDAAASPPDAASEPPSALTAREAAAASVPATGAPDDTIPDPSVMRSAAAPTPSVIVSEELTSPSRAKPTPRAASPAAEPRRPRADATMELPASRTPRLVVAGAAAVALLAIVGGVIAFGGSDDAEEGATRASSPGSVAARASEADIGSTPGQDEAEASGAAPIAATGAGAETADEAEGGPTEAAESEAAGSEAAGSQAAGSEGAGSESAVPEPESAAPRTARLTVRTEPADATLTLDGREVSNPYSGDLEHGSRHRLRAEAAGHRPARESVRLDEDRTVTLRLAARPSRMSSTIRRGAARRAARRERRTRRSARPEPASGGSNRGAGFVTENPY